MQYCLFECSLALPVWKGAGHLDHITDGLGVGAGHFTEVELLVAFFLHFGDHLLEGGTTSDGLENFSRDAVGHAPDALFYERLTLK